MSPLGNLVVAVAIAIAIAIVGHITSSPSRVTIKVGGSPLKPYQRKPGTKEHGETARQSTKGRGYSWCIRKPPQVSKMRPITWPLPRTHPLDLLAKGLSSSATRPWHALVKSLLDAPSGKWSVDC